MPAAVAAVLIDPLAPGLVNGGCFNCHILPETTNHNVRLAGAIDPVTFAPVIARGGPTDLENVVVPNALIEPMPFGIFNPVDPAILAPYEDPDIPDTFNLTPQFFLDNPDFLAGFGLYDVGFYNIGIRPTGEDLSRANAGPPTAGFPDGLPLAYTALADLIRQGALDPVADADVTEFVTTADRLARTVEHDFREDRHETYAHMLVDESQDITPMQWRMLRRRGSQASWTIVGDLAQSSWPDLDEVGRAVRDLIGTAPHRDFRLSVNYRSPAEVFDLAAKVVKAHFPKADLPRAVRSTGHQPELLHTSESALVSDLVRIVDRLTDSVGGTVGVIAPPSRLDHLRTALPPRLSTRMNPANLARVIFVSPLEAKGLEYDAVVVVSPDEVVEQSPGGVRVLYVALTRATQMLVTLDVGGPGAWRPEE